MRAFTNMGILKAYLFVGLILYSTLWISDRFDFKVCKEDGKTIIYIIHTPEEVEE